MKLRKLEKKDVIYMYEWMKDPQMYCYFQFNPENITIESCEKFVENSYNDKDKHFAIVDDNDVYIGTVSIKNIDNKNKNGEYAISVMKQYHGQGVAEFATKNILEISFNELNLNKVYLNVLSDNIRAIKFYEKIGFEYEGEFREHVYINETFKSLKWFSILRGDYNGTI